MVLIEKIANALQHAYQSVAMRLESSVKAPA